MGGPYVQLATFCEKVLQEQDGVISIIRAIDRIILTTSDPQAPSELPPGNIATTLVVALRSDDARGRHPVEIRVQEPSGAYGPSQTLDVVFEGEDRGANLVLNAAVSAVEGLYWFEVRINDAVLTRVPLRIIYQRIRGPV